MNYQRGCASGCAFLFVLMALVVSGCGYPKISPQSYELSKALYAACNQKNEKKLEKIEAMIGEFQERGEIEESESAWLRKIIDQARSGDWEGATLETREIMNDQVDR